MRKTKARFAAKLLGILLLLISASLTFSNSIAAQMQPWMQQEQMRQMYERQQWQQQERARQASDRQQWLQWQQQEQARQMNDRQQWLLWQQQEKLRQILQR